MSGFKNLLYFIVSFSIAFLFWAVIKFFMPNIPVFYFPANSFNDFYNIRLSNIFSNNTYKINISKTINQTLKGVSLKAVYKNGNSGFIIIQHNKKTIFVNLHSKFNGYKLIKILKNSAVFEKNGQKYILKFKEIKNRYTKLNTPNNTARTIKINKQTVLSYKRNLSKVWNNIGIIKTREGYLITYVKPNSIFDKIGLKKGDIIIKVNNQKLTNDAQAWQLYKNIGKYDSLEIELKRHNKIKVINYEMD